MFGSTEMTFGTIGHALHRRRRGAFSHFFSKASVRRLEPFIQTLVDKLCQKLSQYIDTGEPVNMVHAYSALTQDVITEYCFSNCRNVLEMENFSPWYYDLVQKPCELCQMSVPSVIIFLRYCHNKQLIIQQNQAISPLTSNAIPPAQLVGTSHIPVVRPVFSAEVGVRSPSQVHPVSYRQN